MTFRMNQTMAPSANSTALMETDLQRIERITLRPAQIAASLVDNWDKCHAQEQSPLYSKIPKEIRDLIFLFATEQYDDSKNRYPEGAPYSRPGHRAPHKNSTTLLLTCRRIWLETNHMPMQQAVFTFWPDPAPPGERKKRSHLATNWTRLNKRNFKSLHIFFEMESRVAKRNWKWVDHAIHAKKPKALRITIRHTDWHNRENTSALDFGLGWFQSILGSQYLASIQDFTLELEAIDQHKDQLQAIVDQVLPIQGRPRPGAHDLEPATILRLHGAPEWWQWTGPVNSDATGAKAPEELDAPKYQVVEITWRASPTQQFMPVFSPKVPPRGLRRCGYMRCGGQSLSWHQWISVRPPHVHTVLQEQASLKANATEDDRRKQFEKAIADLEATKVEARWRAEGSLLQFEED